jgi:hypothetical protein
MPTEILTIPQYAAKQKPKKDRTAVFKAAKNEKLHLLPDVVKIIKVGRYRLLEVTI